MLVTIQTMCHHTRNGVAIHFARYTRASGHTNEVLGAKKQNGALCLHLPQRYFALLKLVHINGLMLMGINKGVFIIVV